MTAAILAALRDATGRDLYRAPVRTDDLVGQQELIGPEHA